MAYKRSPRTVHFFDSDISGPEEEDSASDSWEMELDVDSVNKSLEEAEDEQRRDSGIVVKAQKDGVNKGKQDSRSQKGVGMSSPVSDNKGKQDIKSQQRKGMNSPVSDNKGKRDRRSQQGEGINSPVSDNKGRRDRRSQQEEGMNSPVSDNKRKQDRRPQQDYGMLSPLGDNKGNTNQHRTINGVRADTPQHKLEILDDDPAVEKERDLFYQDDDYECEEADFVPQQKRQERREKQRAPAAGSGKSDRSVKKNEAAQSVRNGATRKASPSVMQEAKSTEKNAKPMKSKYNGMYNKKYSPPPQAKPKSKQPLAQRSTSQHSSSQHSSSQRSTSQQRSTSRRSTQMSSRSAKSTASGQNPQRTEGINKKSKTAEGDPLVAMDSPKERDDVEIFKLKEPLFYATFIWNDEVFKELVHSGVFSQDELISLKDAVTPKERYHVILEALRSGDGMADLQALSLSLLGNNVDITQELNAEIDLAMGDLMSEERIAKECARLVHLHFGAKKRLAEEEKKILSRMLAERNQIMKHIWENKTLKMVIETRREEERGEQLDCAIDELSKQLHGYVTHNMPGDIPPIDRMATDGAEVSSGYPDHNPDAGVLEGTVLNMCDQVEGMIDGLLGMRTEKASAVNDVLELHIEPDKADSVQLVMNAMQAIQERMGEEAKQAEELDALIATLEAEADREAKVIDKLHMYRANDMDDLNEQIPRNKLELQDLNAYLRELRQQVRFERDEFEENVIRLESLEKGSRINGIYRKDEERKTGRKIRVTQLNGFEVRENSAPDAMNHDTTRTMGHKFFLKNDGGRKTKSAEMLDDLDLL